MIVEPEYNRFIIVGLRWRNIFNWYVTERELWYLKDLEGECYDEKSKRYGIKILDENTIENFLDRIKDYLFQADVIKKIMVERDYSKNKEDVLDFSPSLYVDFDNRALYSLYPEPLPFEEHIPEGWTGKYEDFYDSVPKDQQYWIVAEENFIEKILEK